MRIWVEIWNGAQTEMLGMVDLASASVTAALDKAGSMTLDAAAGNPEFNRLMRGFRYAHVYTDTPRRRRIGQGVLMRHGVSVSGGQRTANWKCSDTLVDLQRVNTLNSRIYDDVPLADVVRDLVALAPGWSAKLEGVSGTTSLRFDGATVLEALMTLVELHGYHFRVGTDRQIVFGDLGDDCGIRLVNVAQVDRTLRSNPRVALIEHLAVQEDWTQVINWLMPFSGPVDGALTLRRSTRALPYPIATEEGPGGTIYVIRDQASIDEHGEIRAVEGPRTLVFPLSISSDGLERAANMLYDWAATQIKRRSGPQISFMVKAAKLDTQQPLVGRKIRLTYKGDAWTLSQDRQTVNVDADFWITQETWQYTLQGVTVDLELSSNSEPPRRPEQIIARALRQTRRQVAQMNVSSSKFDDTLTFTGYGDAQILLFEVKEGTIDITACKVTLTRASTNGPDRVFLHVDGIEVPGGPYLEGVEAGLTATVEIGDVIAGLPVVQGEHTLTVTALYGTGDLEVVLVLYEAVVGLN